MVIERQPCRLRPGRLGRCAPVWRGAHGPRIRPLAQLGHRARNGAQPGQHARFSQRIHARRIRRRASFRRGARGLGLRLLAQPRYRARYPAHVGRRERIHARSPRWHSPVWRRGPSPWPIWKVGCLLADLAMVYTHFGYTGVTPATVAAHSEWFAMNGEIMNAAFSIPGHPATFNRRPTMAWIASWLRGGHPVIVG